MIKNIIALLLFVVLWPVCAAEVFTELDCTPGAYSACKGRYYEKSTTFNAVSSVGQKLWTFQDPLMGDCNPFQDPLDVNQQDCEYNALQIHTCSVTRRQGYFSNMLIAKLELNPTTKFPIRTFQTFLSQALLLGGAKIYAWVDRGSVFLELLSKYGFKETNEDLFIPITSRKVFCPRLNTIQLGVTRQDILDIFG